MGCNPNIFFAKTLRLYNISHSECYPHEIPHEIPCFSLPGQLIPWPEPHAMQHLSSQIWGGRFLWIQDDLWFKLENMGMWWGYQWLWYIYICIYIYVYIYVYIYICIRLYDFMYMYGNLNVENDDQPSNWGTPDLPTKKIVTISISLAQEHECITSITIKLAGILQLVLVFMQRMQFGIFWWFSVCFILPVPRCELAVKIFFLVQEGDTPNRGENDETMGLDGIGGYPIHPVIQRNPAAPVFLKSVSPATHGFLGIWHCVHITPTDIYSDFVSDRPERDSDNRSDISNVLTSYPTYNIYIYIIINIYIYACSSHTNSNMLCLSVRSRLG